MSWMPSRSLGTLLLAAVVFTAVLVPVHLIYPDSTIAAAAILIALGTLVYNRSSLQVAERSHQRMIDGLNVAGETLRTTKASLDHSTRARQLDMLKGMYPILAVRGELLRWLEKMTRMASDLEAAIPTTDADALRSLAAVGPRDPKGLVSRGQYEFTPPWLQAILMAGAQYYYGCMCLTQFMWNEQKQGADFGAAKSLLSRCNEYAPRISELLSYVDEIVPDAIGEAPGRIDDSHFLD